MKKILWTILGASLVMLIGGCGSNDFDTRETNTSTALLTVVTPAGGVYAINTADQDYTVVLQATQDAAPLSGIVVAIQATSFVGSFSAMQATTDANGSATFTYHSPGTVDVNTTFDITFVLEENNATSAKVTFNLGEGGGTDDTNTTTVDNITYAVAFEPANDAFNIGLGMQKSAIVKLVNNDTNASIDSSMLRSIKVTSQDPTVLKLAEESGGTAAAVVTVNNKNDVTLQLIADEHNSGLGTLVVTITYIDSNQVEKTIEKTFSISVLSGPPTAFSINDDGISYNFDTKQFEHKYIIQAVDNSGNHINTEGIINVSAMASFAADATPREMLYGRHAKNNDGISATLSSVGDKGQIQITGITPFDATHISTNRAFVAVFGNVDTYEANGKWNIDAILDNHTLSLGNQYLGTNYSELGMAVGYNYRDKICSSSYEESVVLVDSTDGTYVLGTDGKAFVTLKFDAYMIGKMTAVLVNMVGYDPATGASRRSGEVKFTTQASNEGIKGGTINIPEGSNNIAVRLYGEIDTGTDDSYWLRNATFSCDVPTLENARIDSGPVKNDPTSCNGDGIAYLEYHVTADAGASGTISFDNCQVDGHPAF